MEGIELPAPLLVGMLIIAYAYNPAGRSAQDGLSRFEKMSHVRAGKIPARLKVSEGSNMKWLKFAAMAIVAGCPGVAAAKDAVSCGGAAMLGGAQLNCSHVDPKAPPQFCTYSWALHTTGGDQKIAEGTFMLPPGASNVTIYQGSGFDSALSNPIVISRNAN